MDKSNLPIGWQDVSVYQYQDLVQVTVDGKSIFEKYVEYLSILTNTEAEEWEDLDIEEVGDLIRNLEWLKRQPSSNFKTNVGKYKLIDFKHLTLGQYIDINYFKTEQWKNFHLILAILYRQIKQNEWGNETIEPYGQINLNKRADEFLDLPINDVYGVINSFNQFDEKFKQTYYNQFNPDIPEEDLDPEEDLTIEDKKEIEKEKERANWAWESLIYNLCDGDLTKYDAVLELPLIFVFNQITFKKLFNIQ